MKAEVEEQIHTFQDKKKMFWIWHFLSFVRPVCRWTTLTSFSLSINKYINSISSNKELKKNQKIKLKIKYFIHSNMLPNTKYSCQNMKTQNRYVYFVLIFFTLLRVWSPGHSSTIWPGYQDQPLHTSGQSSCPCPQCSMTPASSRKLQGGKKK